MDAILERMNLIPTHSTMEHFNRAWFDVGKMTASNYRDMVGRLFTGEVCAL
jgi:hypothetical protein